MRSVLIALFVLLPCGKLLLAQTDTADRAGFTIGLAFHEGMERRASFMLPSLGWEKGRHRIRAGAVVGSSYRVRAGTEGKNWVSGGRVGFRGACMTYGVSFWEPSSMIALRGGFDLYYLREGYRVEKGAKDPLGIEYDKGHQAARRSWGFAPFLGVELELGSDFSLMLGFQPLRYQWSEYRWDPKKGRSFKGSSSERRFLLQKVGVTYSP